MRRIVLALLGLYLLVAFATRVAERAGLHRCGCPPDCWCKRPGLSLFRWVFPFRHKSVDPAMKEAMAGVRNGLPADPQG